MRHKSGPPETQSERLVRHIRRATRCRNAIRRHCARVRFGNETGPEYRNREPTFVTQSGIQPPHPGSGSCSEFPKQKSLV